jgi:hypothetical protein
MKITLKDRPILKDLDEGLILCRSNADDAEGLAEFNSRIHSDDGFDSPDLRLAAWVRDMLARPHPTFKTDDFTMVVEKASGRIISSMNLIPQTWAYAGIPFTVGRPEVVGTLPEFRDRGLVRKQFEVIHQLSEERGDRLQAITGIPYYYRLFGYEMGLELGGGRVGFEAQLPKLAEGEKEPFHLRLAKEADIPFLMSVYAHACQRRLVTCVRTEEIWRYELEGQSRKNVSRQEIRIIERSGTKETVGYLVHPWYDWDTGLVASHYELKPGISWLEVTPTVARHLWQTGGSFAERDGKPEVRSAYGFWFGSEHPAYDIFRERLPRIREPYAWYVRVADLPGFLRLIRPVLEERLARSSIPGYQGEAKISFFRSGLRLVFEAGKLITIENWKPVPGVANNAWFPDLTFLQLVFGYRTFDDLKKSYADCGWKDDEARVLLSSLFPRQSSSVMMVA